MTHAFPFTILYMQPAEMLNWHVKVGCLTLCESADQRLRSFSTDALSFFFVAVVVVVVTSSGFLSILSV